jgi:hypothetical protein
VSIEQQIDLVHLFEIMSLHGRRGDATLLINWSRSRRRARISSGDGVGGNAQSHTGWSSVSVNRNDGDGGGRVSWLIASAFWWTHALEVVRRR